MAICWTCSKRPSAGLIREKTDPISIGRIYEDAGAAAISLLTDKRFFQGDLEHLPRLKAAISLPILRKDFIIDEVQIREALFYGADAVLLIAAMLEKNQADELLHLSSELGLSVLFEVHNGRELDMALTLGSPIIGINNRNLKTLHVDLRTTFDLLGQIPIGKILVSESGVRTREDVRRLEAAGIDALLIGTALMEAGDPGIMIDSLRGKG